MKITRLNTVWDAEQIILLLGMIDELREALCYTYQVEIQEYQHQQWLERQKDNEDAQDFDDYGDF